MVLGAIHNMKDFKLAPNIKFVDGEGAILIED